MRVLKVRYAEYGRGQRPLVIELDMADLSGEQYAELRVSIDLCQIIQMKKSYLKPASGQPGVFIIVETDSSIHAAHFLGDPPEAVKNLAEMIKELSHKVGSDLAKSA